jgi:hypothetical protein
MHAAAYEYAMLEADHEIEVDGTWSILGTGTEDYFAGGFYFREGPFALPTAGLAGIDMSVLHRPVLAMYRHHLIDPIPYSASFRFEYESFEPGTLWEACLVRYVAGTP